MCTGTRGQNPETRLERASGKQLIIPAASLRSVISISKENHPIHLLTPPIHLPSPAESQSSEKDVVALRYIKRISETLSRVLNNEGIKVGYKPIKTLLTPALSETKDRVSPHETRDIIYKIDCKNCDVAYYDKLNRKDCQYEGYRK